MVIGSLEQVAVHGVAAGGDGIARLGDGMVVFCEGGLPGEEVVIQVTDRRRDFSRGTVVDVVAPSPMRRTPPCPFVGAGCGGCTWQHVDPAAQSELKAGIVRDALRRIGRLPDVPVIIGPGEVPEAGYRTGLRLAVDAHGQPAYRRRHSNDLIPVDSCLVAHPLLAELVADARFPGAGEVGLRVGAATGDRMAWPDREVDAQVPEGTGIGPDASIVEVVAGRRWQVSAGAFFQSGPQAAEALVAAVRRAAGPVLGPIVDLYSGGGLLGGSLAAANPGVELVAVESNPAAVGDARVNLRDLGARVVGGQVSEYGRARRTSPAGLVVADPARTGLGPAAAGVAAGLGASTIVLVSCDPASLARDARILGPLGYALEVVEIVDVFPDTFHTETVSRFRAVGMGPAGR